MEDYKTTEFGQNMNSQLHPVLLLREVANKFIAIVLVAIIVMSATFIFLSATYQPQYQTKTTFVVSVRNGTLSVYSNLNTTKGLTGSLAQVLSSDVMKKQIASELGVDKINGSIETTQVEDTNILEMRVTAPSPREAFLITATLLNCYEPLVDEVLNNAVLDILQHPVVPTAAVNPAHAKLPVALAGLASIAAVIVLLGVMTYLRDTVKTADEAEGKLDAKILGTVRYESKYKTLKSKLERKKTSILITNPTTSFDFVETFRKLRTRIDYTMRRKDYKTLMITSVEENEGKSTVAVNLALAMKKKLDNVLLIDADLKKPSLHKILEYQPKIYVTVSDLLDGEAEFEDAVITDKETGLRLLLGRGSVDNSMELLSGKRMNDLLAEAKKTMDVVIIDTPPMTAGLDTESISEHADASVLVVRQDGAPVRIINDMIDVLNDSPASFLGCILNNFRSADINDSFSYGHGKYSYGKYGYSKYGYEKYGYAKEEKHSRHSKEER